MAYLKRTRNFSGTPIDQDPSVMGNGINMNGQQNGVQQPQQVQQPQPAANVMPQQQAPQADPEQVKQQAAEELAKTKKYLKMLLRFPGELYIRQFTSDISSSEYLTIEVSFDPSEYFSKVKQVIESFPIKNTEVEEAEKKPDDAKFDNPDVNSLVANCISSISALRKHFKDAPEERALDDLFAMVTSLKYRLKLRKTEL